MDLADDLAVVAQPVGIELLEEGGDGGVVITLVKKHRLQLGVDRHGGLVGVVEVIEHASLVQKLLDTVEVRVELIDGSYWILTWLDQRESADRMHDGLFAQRVNTDGTLGSTTAGISRTETDKAPESVDVYTLDGRTVMTGAPASKAEGLGKGIYVVKDKATGKARKIAVK